MRLPSLDKTAFVLSVAVFAFLYGIATQAFGWFPSDLVRRAWNQAEAVSPLSTIGIGGVTPTWRTSRVYDRTGVHFEKPEAVQSGPVLIASVWPTADGWRPGLRLINRDGELLHEWSMNPDSVFPDPPKNRSRRPPNLTNIHGSYLFPNGDVLVNLEYVGTVRLDACSRVRWRLPYGGHHSIHRADDGTFWISGGSWERREGEGATETLPGLPEQVYHDRLLQVTAAGEVVRELDLLDVLYANDLQRYIAKGSRYAPGNVPEDVTHLNDIEPLPSSIADEYPLFEAGDLAVSVHHLDLVFVVDPESLRVKWHTTTPFIQQHDPDFVGNGWIGVFDNNRDGTERGSMLGGSRIIALQPHTDSIKKLFPTAHSDQFYTEVQGKWQQLDNGNFLLTESTAGRIVEVTPDGRTAWEWVTNPYDRNSIASVTEGTRYNLTEQEVSAWPCSPGDLTANQREVTP